MSSYARQQLESYLKTLEIKADSVLDIGGSQKPIKGRTKTWEVENYKILDLEQPHEGEKPDIVADIEIDNNLDRNNTFDVVFCLEVSEYWIDPWRAIDSIYSYTKRGGVLYISFPFIYPMHKPEGLDYLRYTPNGAKKLLEVNGFEVVSLFGRYEKEGLSIRQWFSFNGMRPDEKSEHNLTAFIIKAIKK